MTSPVGGLGLFQSLAETGVGDSATGSQGRREGVGLQ